MHETLCIFNNAFLSVYFDSIIQTKTYTITLSNEPHTWNVANSLNFPNKQSIHYIEEIEKKFPIQNNQYIFWITKEDNPSNLANTLMSKGYAHSGDDIWMQMQKPKIPYPIPSSHTIVKVKTPDQLDDFTEIFRAVFSDSQGTISNMFKRKLFDPKYTHKTYLFILYIENKPVSIGGYVIYENTAIIYSVGTKEEYRKQGYAKSLCAYMINHIHEESIILSTEIDNQAQHLYADLGFRVFMQTEIYSKYRPWS